MNSEYENHTAVKPAIKPAVKRKLNIKPKINEETTTIKHIIDTENNIEKHIQNTNNSIPDNEKKILGHLGNYIEEPYQIIESYFEGKHLDRLVRHQIESYNNFVNYQVQHTIDMFNPVKIHSENDFIPETNQYILECHVRGRKSR